ncbi:MAG TPA: 2-dehydropantoate 2-reductase [Anaerolineae bacterium]|nr:2-dehydropantoate 2-reductase [Anaerolineae bacterium]
MSSKPRLLIVGTGAMACLFGARLAEHARVTLLGTWLEGLEALQNSGVRLRETDGNEHRMNVAASHGPANCKEIKLALVLVKSWQTQRAASQLADCLAEDGIALTLQNGLGNLEILQQALGTERAALGVTTSGATLLGPGYVRAGGAGTTHLGSHPRLKPMADLLRRAGFQIEYADDLEGLLWGKLAINAGINPLTAILRVPNGMLCELPYARRLMQTAAQETATVASSLGIALPYDDAAAAVVEVAKNTASNHSSMLQDIKRGAPTEIDAICGAVARHAETQSLTAPVNWTLWHLIRALIASSSGEKA